MITQGKRRSWTEISLSKLKVNLNIFRKNSCADKTVMAVVKADAYGHGDSVIAKFLSENGISNFAVSNLDEAIHLRKAGVKGQILILGYTPIDRVHELAENDITQALLSEEYAERLAKVSPCVKCQFAIDTGMRRIGLNGYNPDECERIIRKYANKLMLNGIFTHLCVADNPGQDEFTGKQISLFETIVSQIEDLKLPYCHCMNSAGGLWYQSNASVFNRLGIILYGLKPDYLNELPKGIEPALAWKSVVSMVKNVEPGDTIGYGRSFTVDRTMRIATIPTGYADGYPRLLSNKWYVLINGYKAPIVGTICMDQMMVDVSNIPRVEMETEVVLIGKSGKEVITADDIAHCINTIGYEIVCNIGKRVERIYLE